MDVQKSRAVCIDLHMSTDLVDKQNLHESPETSTSVLPKAATCGSPLVDRVDAVQGSGGGGLGVKIVHWTIFVCDVT